MKPLIIFAPMKNENEYQKIGPTWDRLRKMSEQDASSYARHHQGRLEHALSDSCRMASAGRISSDLFRTKDGQVYSSISN